MHLACTETKEEDQIPLSCNSLSRDFSQYDIIDTGLSYQPI